MSKLSGAGITRALVANKENFCHHGFWLVRHTCALYYIVPILHFVLFWWQGSSGEKKERVREVMDSVAAAKSAAQLLTKLAAEPEGYAECYPGLDEMQDAIDDSDDEVAIKLCSYCFLHFSPFHTLPVARWTAPSRFVLLFSHSQARYSMESPANRLEPGCVKKVQEWISQK